MEKKEINIINTRKILKFVNNLEKISQYIKNKEIIDWTKQDINEIYYIQKSLKEKGLLDKAYNMKEITNIKVDKTENIEKRAFKVYSIINKELNSWRNINLNINI